MDIADNITRLRKDIPPAVKIIAVSKTMPVSCLLEAYNTGLRAFGENKVQELVEKQTHMPPDTEWHMIGHLQTNKVKYIVPFIHLIHSVDSLKLLREINLEASKIKRRVGCLLQMHIATEESKYGLSYPEVSELLNAVMKNELKHIEIRGLMGMATFTDDRLIVSKEFNQLSGYFTEIKNTWFAKDPSFCEISMGMSGDFKIALASGSTMVRIGNMIFGERNYKP